MANNSWNPIDTDLVAGNVKSGIDIFGVTGNYDWWVNDNKLLLVSNVQYQVYWVAYSSWVSSFIIGNSCYDDWTYMWFFCPVYNSSGSQYCINGSIGRINKSTLVFEQLWEVMAVDWNGTQSPTYRLDGTTHRIVRWVGGNRRWLERDWATLTYNNRWAEPAWVDMSGTNSITDWWKTYTPSMYRNDFADSNSMWVWVSISYIDVT